MNYGGKWLVAFIIGLALTGGAEWLRTANQYERVTFTALWQQHQTVTIDLAQQGLIKYWLQPGTIRIYGRIKVPPTSTELTVQGNGERLEISQASKRSNWQDLTSNSVLRVTNGQVPLYIEVAIPYQRTRKHLVGEAELELRQSTRSVQIIRLRFINSHYAN